MSDAKIVEDDAGLWAVARMPPLAGGDDWSHYAHGPDQNRVTTDTVVKSPFKIQWTGKPYLDGKFDMSVAAGGRQFRANATLGVLVVSKTNGIVARNIYNGRVLWTRKTADDFGGFGSLIVATPEVVYVKDGNGVPPTRRGNRRGTKAVCALQRFASGMQMADPPRRRVGHGSWPLFRIQVPPGTAIEWNT